ncbi:MULTISPECIES: polyketide synthase, partial [unclassified Frankia]|uniref:type I polyketide synthase n=1 Tax=unclassified Frankia TaxID=2632575 RepID=UPI002AD2C17F
MTGTPVQAGYRSSGSSATLGKPVPEPVAIIGIGCRLPGAHGTDEFWRVLRTGSDTVTQIPADRAFGSLYDPRPGTPGRIASRAGGFLTDIDAFDADFFDVSPREAARMDPQQRLLLETSWEAFEDAGQTRGSLTGTRTSVFLAYLSTQYSELLREAGICDMHSAIGAEGRGTAAGRLSYAFDLRGPSMALDATCASSLLAIHLACQSIRSGESTLALAGGVNIMLTPDLSIALSQAGVLSRYGRSRFGDAAADGYVRSEAVAVVILKSLEQARADGDQVYAVIRGSGVTNDGRSGGFVTAPSVESQAEMLRTAYHNAGVEPGDIDYIEAHGTGTVMGDQIELTAIAEVLSEGRPSDRPCVLGSAKSNIGHTEGAAGMVGIIKVALSLRHRTIPASLHIAEPNPAVPWDELPIELATTVRRWPDRGRPRLAGVSAFGLSGTNVHVVLAEAPC